MKNVIFCIGLLASLSACDGFAADRSIPEGRDDITQISENDAEMNAAIAEAKRTLPQFIAIMKSGGNPPDEAGFKYPLGGFEHIWVDNVELDGGVLLGTLANEPGQPEYKMGQKVRVPLNQISDWAYRDDRGVMQGHYTTKVLLPKLDPEYAASVRQSFGWSQ